MNFPIQKVQDFFFYQEIVSINKVIHRDIVIRLQNSKEKSWGAARGEKGKPSEERGYAGSSLRNGSTVQKVREYFQRAEGK